MNWLTPSFLILLRLAIGCHFLIEGMGKIQDPAWSGAPFLRQASGPWQTSFQGMTGDAVDESFTLRHLRADEDPGQTPPHTRLPPAVERSWNAYFNQYVAHYIDGDQERRLAEVTDEGPRGDELRRTSSDRPNNSVSWPSRNSSRRRTVWRCG